MDTIESTPKTIIEKARSSWAYQTTEADSLSGKGITGKGIKIAVIDPNIRPDPEVNRGRHNISGNVREVHGYGIGTIIKSLLPDAQVTLMGIRNAMDVSHALNTAVNAGYDVISMSMSQPTPDPILTSRALTPVTDAMQGKVASSHREKLQAIEKYHIERAHESSDTAAQMAIEKTIARAERKGIVVVAATGYTYTKLENTFETHPNVLMVGGVTKTGNSVETPKGARIDVYAPADEVIYGKDRGGTIGRVSNSHSFAAPFVTVACAVAKGQGVPSGAIRQRIVDTAQNHNGKKIVNFKRLIEG